MIQYWANLHGEWVDLTATDAWFRKLEPGRLPDFDEDIEADYYEILLDGTWHYVHKSCIQVTRTADPSDRE